MFAFPWVASLAESPAPEVYRVGVASVDITPELPIRLCGYACRTEDATHVIQRLRAKAMVIDDGRGSEGITQPAVLVVYDGIGFADSLREAVLRRLAGRGVVSDRFALCVTHSHSTPMVSGFSVNMYGHPLPAEMQARADRYTQRLEERLVEVVEKALEVRRPATLAAGCGKATFGKNRRPQGGSSDNDVPTLLARDANGKTMAVVINYACHCTNLKACCPEDGIAGDWAGFAQTGLEEEFPGAVAFTIIGCGGDQDPYPRVGLEFTKQNAQSLVDTVKQVAAGLLAPVRGRISCRAKRLELPYDTLPTRAQWEEKAKSDNPWIAYHAKLNLAVLDRGETLPTVLPYPVQAWMFGDSLAMVFLGGEPVADYAVRFKSEYDRRRVWITAYANSIPGYIPSQRVWREGGYEGGDAIIYENRPARMTEDVESRVFDALHELMPAAFKASEKTAGSEAGTAF